MALVVLADDAYAFMVMWETMALSSFFLVIANHRIAEIRRAGYLYLLVAHIGAIGILLCFGVLQANTGDYTFANMRAQQLTPFWASVAFLLALFGFGAKAGIAAAARLAARSAPRGAVAGLGADERRDAEDRRLRPAARRLRPAADAVLVVGRRAARARAGDRAVRRRLRRGAGRHEAAARLLVDREHRPVSPASASRCCSRPTA